MSNLRVGKLPDEIKIFTIDINQRPKDRRIKHSGRRWNNFFRD